MEILNFRYTNDIDVSIRSGFSTINMFFRKKDKYIMKFTHQKYFKSLMFYYDIFSSDFFENYVKITTKDGNAFIARICYDGTFFAIRKKKRKSQIVFMKAGKRGFKNYQLGNDVVDAICFHNGIVSRDEGLLLDFFEKRAIKPFNEEEYINSLDPEERKEYLEFERINSIIEEIGKKYKIESKKIEHLITFVNCMSDENEIKKMVLNNDNIDEIASKVLPLQEKASKFYEKEIDDESYSYPETVEYTIDSKYVFTEDNFDMIDFHLNDEQMFVYDLLYFFEDEFYSIKDYLEKGIETAKKTIDEVLPFFKQYIQDTNLNNGK